MSNIYLPKGLPLLNDYALRDAVATYREALRALPADAAPAPMPTMPEIDTARRDMEEALRLMEHELQDRGIRVDGSYPNVRNHRSPHRIESPHARRREGARTTDPAI